MGLFGVSPEKEKKLYEKMARFGIYESDINEQFIRSGGKGGQNVNKTSTCVYLKHLPTGIEVRCQQERSQVLNRYVARKILAGKIEEKVLGKLSSEQQKFEKIRRQKRRRSRRAKERMLEGKHAVSDKKECRKRVEY